MDGSHPHEQEATISVWMADEKQASKLNDVPEELPQAIKEVDGILPAGRVTLNLGPFRAGVTARDVA